MSAPFRVRVLQKLRQCVSQKHLRTQQKIIKCYRLMGTSPAAAEKTISWSLHSSVCLERYPVITQDLSPLEQEYTDFMMDKEIRCSLLSDHELQALQEKLIVKEREVSEETGKMSRVTVLDKEIEWEDERLEFTPADRLTADDKSNNQKSPNRKLDRKLILIVKYKVDGEEVWTLPQVEHEEGESMRQTAERALSTCGGSIHASFVGNAPAAFYQYRYPDSQSDRLRGVKVFMFRAGYKKGDMLQICKDFIDYKWVTREEMPEYLNKIYAKQVLKAVTEY